MQREGSLPRTLLGGGNGKTNVRAAPIHEVAFYSLDGRCVLDGRCFIPRDSFDGRCFAPRNSLDGRCALLGGGNGKANVRAAPIHGVAFFSSDARCVQLDAVF